jgi:hypothetical protein
VVLSPPSLLNVFGQEANGDFIKCLVVEQKEFGFLALLPRIVWLCNNRSSNRHDEHATKKHSGRWSAGIQAGIQVLQRVYENIILSDDVFSIFDADIFLFVEICSVVFFCMAE